MEMSENVEISDEIFWKSGLKITAGQRTMSGLIMGLTGQTLVWPVILTGHFWMLVA